MPLSNRHNLHENMVNIFLSTAEDVSAIPETLALSPWPVWSIQT